MRSFRRRKNHFFLWFFFVWKCKAYAAKTEWQDLEKTLHLLCQEQWPVSRSNSPPMAPKLCDQVSLYKYLCVLHAAERISNWKSRPCDKGNVNIQFFYQVMWAPNAKWVSLWGKHIFLGDTCVSQVCVLRHECQRCLLLELNPPAPNIIRVLAFLYIQRMSKDYVTDWRFVTLWSR